MTDGDLRNGRAVRPTFLRRDLVVFAVLAAVIAFGFFSVRRNDKVA